MPSSALPLNVSSSTPSRVIKVNNKDTTPTQVNREPSNTAVGSHLLDISSPHELTAFVETILEQLDAKFDEMSTQILDRMSQMSVRVDALEAAIQDIITNGEVNTGSLPSSPIPASPSINAGR